MQLNDFLIDALDRVLAWDLPDEVCTDAVSSQAALMAGADPEQVGAVDMS